MKRLNLATRTGAICGLALVGFACHAESAPTTQKTAERLGTVIVCAPGAIAPERKAAEELKGILSRITGREYTIVLEDKAASDTPAIYVGQTAFAGRVGLDFADFAQEEYALKTVGEHLVIGGGQPNGSWNGVCHFLTRELGCRFLAWDCEVVPHHQDLLLPALNLRREPSFAGRHINVARFRQEDRAKISRYMRWNYANAHTSPYDRLSTEREATMCHNSFYWVDHRKYAKSHPEYFSRTFREEELKTKETRYQMGHVCWTNHDVWDITLRKLREVIKKDHVKLPKWKWPTVYQISQNDVQGYCSCPKCEAALKKLGNLAAVQLQYINYVAEAIAKDYPDVKIMAFAYVHTEDAPGSIRPADNVIIQWADLYTRSDCYRPLTGKFNTTQKAKLEGWQELGATFSIWDYWNMGIPGPYFGPPRVEIMVDSIAPDLRYFARVGAKSLFFEVDFCAKHPQNFFDLQAYLGYQLMADISLAEEMLIKDFMAGYYGPAAPAMTEFLTMLRKAVKNEKEALVYITNPVRTYTNGVFLAEVYRLLKIALATVPAGSDYHRRVQQEMVTPLAVIILNPQYGFCKRTGLPKEDIVAEYRKLQLDRLEQPWVNVERRKKDTVALETEIAGMTLEIPTPDFLKTRTKIVKFAWPQMNESKHYGVAIESAPDSPMGRALVARGKRGQEKGLHNLNKSFIGGLYPDNFGIHSASDKRSATTIKTPMPQDEKYHWYRMAAFELGPNTFLWGFYWRMRVGLSPAFSNADGLPGYNVWETWISVKYAGPSYVQGSQVRDGIFLDRVILVKPEQSVE